MLLRWLVARQTAELGEVESDEEEDATDDAEEPSPPKAVEGLPPSETIDQLPTIPPPTADSLQWAGFNGRANKLADTCYSFWNGATLSVRPLPKRYIYISQERN